MKFGEPCEMQKLHLALPGQNHCFSCPVLTKFERKKLSSMTF